MDAIFENELNNQLYDLIDENMQYHNDYYKINDMVEFIIKYYPEIKNIMEN